MDRNGIASSTIEQLVEAYRQAAAAHWKATLDGDYKTVNRHYDPDKSLRSKAAAHGLEFAPELAEPVLVELTADDGIVGLTAKMALEQWRKGDLKFP